MIRLLTCIAIGVWIFAVIGGGAVLAIGYVAMELGPAAGIAAFALLVGIFIGVALWIDSEDDE